MARLRPAAEEERPPGKESLLAGIAGGVRCAATDPVLRSALLLTTAAAAGLLPAVSLLGPLLARGHGWGPATAGLVAAGQGAGMLLAARAAARLGLMRRIGAGASLGLVLAAAGLAALAAAPDPAVAIATAGAVGAGSGVFACHLAPLVLAGTPSTHLSRVQSLLSLVQSLALVVANNVLGWLASTSGAGSALVCCAVLAGAAGAAGWASAPLRGVRRDAA
jgi:MFS family permease